MHENDNLNLLKKVGEKAADIALSYFRKNPKTWLKNNNTSSVSEADMAVDAYLKSELMAARPDYGWLSEETEDTPHRLSKKNIFVVDPIDGTRAYLKGDAKWCIALAIVEGEKPVTACIIAPALEKIYTASYGGGAYCGSEKIQVSTHPFSHDLLVANAPREGRWEKFKHCNLFAKIFF
jgi:myo-inositol-1(or 4)-monophosphatase